NGPVGRSGVCGAQVAGRVARFHRLTSLVHVTALPVPGRGAVWSVTVTNVSTVYIPGPVLIAFPSLPQGVVFAPINACTPAGEGLAPGQAATAIVRLPGPLPLLSPEIVAELRAGWPQRLTPPPPPRAPKTGKRVTA